MAAKAASLRVIGTTAFASNKDRRTIALKRAGADYIIDNIDELMHVSGMQIPAEISDQDELQTAFMK